MGKPTTGLRFGLLFLMHVSQFFTMSLSMVLLSSSLLPAQASSSCSL
jgi:hypothetical protein